LVVSVAASVYDALDEIAGLYRATTGVTVALNAGGSNTLARQIVEGAKAGSSSAPTNPDGRRGESRPHRPGTRTRLLTNELAVVVPQSTKRFTLAQLLEGASRAGDGRARRGSRRCLRRSGSSTKARGAAGIEGDSVSDGARGLSAVEAAVSMRASCIAPTRRRPRCA
jgi:hypothetical protein